MLDLLVWGMLRFVIMSLITALAAAALVCAHWGVLRLLGGSAGGAGFLIASAALGIAAAGVIRHRNDLVDQ